MTGSRSAKVFRMMVFYTSLILYCSIVLTIMVICNVNPDNDVVVDGATVNIIWKELFLVQNISMLNAVCGTAICCLLVSWMLDILCQNVSKNIGVYHGAWRDLCCCCTSWKS